MSFSMPCSKAEIGGCRVLPKDSTKEYILPTSANRLKA